MPRCASYSVLKILLLATLLPVFGNAQGSDSTKAAESDSTSTELSEVNASSITTNLDNTFSIISLVLPHNSLRNSKTLHNWPFFAFAVPAWAVTYNAKMDMGKLLTMPHAGFVV